MRAFNEEVALPVSEVGPWDRAPLMRLAAAWAAEAMGVSLKKKWLRERKASVARPGATKNRRRYQKRLNHTLSQLYGSTRAQEMKDGV